jgi:hypothetical protein
VTVLRLFALTPARRSAALYFELLAATLLEPGAPNTLHKLALFPISIAEVWPLAPGVPANAIFVSFCTPASPS